MSETNVNWKRVALEAIRYLTAEQIAEVGRATGMQTYICTPTPARSEAVGGEESAEIAHIAKLAEHGWELINGFVRDLHHKADETRDAANHGTDHTVLDALYGTVKRLRDDATAVNAALLMSERAAHELASLRQQLAAAREDGERLDWLERTYCQLIEVEAEVPFARTDTGLWLREWIAANVNNLRNAIDARLAQDRARAEAGSGEVGR